MITQNVRENRSSVPQSGTTLLHDSSTIPQKTPKKKKDPNAPKAASNAYMIFCKERRAELKLENPKLAFGKIGAKLGEIWRNLSSEEKRPYEERASSDRERYRKQMESYKSDHRNDSHHSVSTPISTPMTPTTADDSNLAICQKRSAENLEESNLDPLGEDPDSQFNKRLKSEPIPTPTSTPTVPVPPTNSNVSATSLSPHYHDVGLYSHSFGNPDDKAHDNDPGLEAFGSHVVGTPSSIGVHSHLNETGSHELLDIGGIHDTDGLGRSSDLGINVHHDLEESSPEQAASESPNA